MPASSSTPAPASTGRVTRHGLIARRPGAVTRSASKAPVSKISAVGPATPNPTPVKTAAQRRKEAELKAKKAEVSREKAKAIMAAERADDDNNNNDSAPAIAVANDVDDTLAALGTTFLQQSRRALEEDKTRRALEKKARRAEEDQSDPESISDVDDAHDDANDDDEAPDVFDEEFGVDEDNGPDIVDMTKAAPQPVRKRKATDEVEVDDDIRVPQRKSAKVIAAEFLPRKRGLLKNAKNISRAELMTEDAYHTPYNLEERITSTIHRTA
ncbi:hypothetical protein CYLTODRAFT_447853, partial [Cylindrobasidium torrendii FP15055 ss-10]